MKDKIQHTWLLAIAVTAVSAISAQAVAVNLFANGGFEIPGVTTPAESWLPAASGYTLSNDANTGSFSAQLNSPPTNAAIFLQNSIGNGGLPGVTPGDNPILSFFAKGFAGTTGNVGYSLRYLDSMSNIIYNSGFQAFQGSINTSTWTQITFNSPEVPVGAKAAFIEFSQGLGPVGLQPDGVTVFLPGTIVIDDVVLLGEAIPEPSSVALLGLGSVALLARRRRQA